MRWFVLLDLPRVTCKWISFYKWTLQHSWLWHRCEHWCRTSWLAPLLDGHTLIDCLFKCTYCGKPVKSCACQDASLVEEIRNSEEGSLSQEDGSSASQPPAKKGIKKDRWGFFTYLVSTMLTLVMNNLCCWQLFRGYIFTAGKRPHDRRNTNRSRRN